MKAYLSSGEKDDSLARKVVRFPMSSTGASEAPESLILQRKIDTVATGEF